MAVSPALKLALEIQKIVSKKVPRGDEYVTIVCLAYLVHRRCLTKSRMLGEFSELNIPEDIKGDVIRLGVEDIWPEMQSLYLSYTDDDYKEVVEYFADNRRAYGFAASTPKSLSSLVYSLLDVKNGNTVVDLGHCCGSFLSHVIDRSPQVKVYGYEADANFNVIARCRMLLRAETNENLTAVLTNGEVFAVAAEELEAKKQNGAREGVDDDSRKLLFSTPEISRKVFAHYPVRELKRPGANSIVAELANDVGLSVKQMSVDWLYHGLVAKTIGYKGRGVCVMSLSCAWKESDYDARKAFVECGLVECVIELPHGIYPSVESQLAIIILSRGNKGVRLVDASRLFEISRRTPVFNEEHIRQIVEESKAGGKYFSIEQLEKNGFCLSASRVDKLSLTMSSGEGESCTLDSIVKLNRGLILRAEEIDAAITEAYTGMRYLSVSGIVDNDLAPDLPNIDVTKIHRKVNEKIYCAKNKAIIVTRNGIPPRLAVVNLAAGEKLLVNNNLYMLTVDATRADADYVKLYLESDAGMKLLKMAFTGGRVGSLDMGGLLAMKIPLPSLAKQRAFVAKYMKVKGEADALKARLRQLSAELATLRNGIDK